MNPYTGEIVTPETTEDFEKLLRDSFIPIDDDQMTDKQRHTKQVSQYDNRSELGKLYMQTRKERQEFNALNMNDSKTRTKRQITKAKAKRKASKQARKNNR